MKIFFSLNGGSVSMFSIFSLACFFLHSTGSWCHVFLVSFFFLLCLQSTANPHTIQNQFLKTDTTSASSSAVQVLHAASALKRPRDPTDDEPSTVVNVKINIPSTTSSICGLPRKDPVTHRTSRMHALPKSLLYHLCSTLNHLTH